MPVNSFENYPMSWKPQKEQLQKPFYLSIASGLEQDIRSGRLPEHTKLPPQRELADFLDLNLSTITRAYKLCELKGLLYAVTGRGTFVAPGISTQDTFLDQGGENQKIIEMGVIKPFYETNPIVRNTAQLVLQKESSLQLFEYSGSLGTKRQFHAAGRWLQRCGIDAGEENILISAGAQNALSVVLISLFQAGDRIAVDPFTYTNFKELAHFLHIRLVAVDGDGHGMSPVALLRACRNTQIKGLYLMPTCSNPTGNFMPLNRREALAKIAKRYHLLVVEDDIYSFLAPKDAVPFYTLLPEQTIHICSISKSLCAGLRVAFMAFPGQYRESLVAGFLSINLKTVSLNGEIIAELIESGEAEKIVEEKIRLARSRNRIFASVFPTPVQEPVGKFFHWLPLPDSMTGEEAELLAFRKGVHVLGSHRFAVQQESQASFLRVSVTSPPTEEALRTGLLTLKGVLEEKQREFFV